MDDMNDTLNDTFNDTPALNESLWAFDRDVGSYFVAAMYALILILAPAWNSFVIVVMLYKRLVFKESSTVFLFALALVDLFAAVTILPFYLITVASGGWIFGSTDATRTIVCEAVGFMVAIFIALSVHIVALIALDRMLMILLVLQYPRYMKPCTAWLFVLLVLIIAVILASTPFYGLGGYFFFEPFGGCTIRWRGQIGYIGLYVGEHVIPIATMIITSIVTFIYVRKFLRKVERRQSQWSLSPHTVEHDHRVKQRTTTRIFVVLLITQVVCFVPPILLAAVGIALGSFDEFPNILFLISFVLLMLNTVANPIVQSIFRKEIRDVVMRIYRGVCKRRNKREPLQAYSNSSENEAPPISTVTTASQVEPPSQLTVVPTINGKVLDTDSEEESRQPTVGKQVSFHLKPIHTPHDTDD